MKLKAFLFFGSLCASVYAAEQPRDMQPAPPPPPLDAKGGQPQVTTTNQAAPPAGEPSEGEPQVTITNQDVQTIKELRVSGRLYAIKITPKHGKPYYLVDSLGDGKFARQESLDSGVRVPLWVIKKF